MRMRKVKRAAFCLCSLTASVCLAFAGIFSLRASGTENNAPASPKELFSENSNVTKEEDFSASAVTAADGTTVLFPQDASKKGVKFTAQTETVLSLNKTFSGVFEMDFRSWSDLPVNNEDAWNDFTDTHTYDLREAQLIFDDGVNTFTLHIYAGGKGRACTASAGVSVNGGTDVYSIFYNDTTGEIASYRANSYATQIFGASMSQRGRGNGKFFSSTETLTTRVGFDPDTMDVYVYGTDTDNKTVTKYTVWNLSRDLDKSLFTTAPKENVKTLQSFGEEYTVRFAFADIEEGRTAKTVIYSVCGQSLSGKGEFTEDSGPTVSLIEPDLGEVGQSFDLTRAVTSINDFFEGKISVFQGEIEVTAPDGTKQTLNNESGYTYMPDQAGQYTLVYRARDAKGNTGASNAVVWTVLHESLTEGTAITELFEMENSITLQANADTPSYASKYRGVTFVSEKSGATFRYKNAIRLNKEVPFIEFMALTTQKGRNDFGTIDITLTDAKNSSNYLTIRISASTWNSDFSFVRAGANGAKLGGWDYDRSSVMYQEGYGFSFMHSFSGESRTGKTSALYFDNEENTLQVLPVPHAGQTTVMDFDNSKYMNTSSSYWYGFESDEVYLSVSLSSFTSSRNACLFISAINGQTLEGEYIYDTKSPEIYPDLLGYDITQLPCAEAGRAYPVFAARAYDETDGNISEYLIRKAFYDYGTEAQREIPISEDGTFTPDTVGDVTIEYSVADTMGNAAVKTLTVSVKSMLEPIEIVFDEAIRSSVFVGEKYRIPTYTLVGGSGNKNISVILKKDGEDIAFGGRDFYPESEGDYVLSFSACDFIGQTETFSYSITVSISDAPILTVGEFPPAFIAGSAYELPAASATDWKSENGVPVSVPVKITVCYEGETPQEITGKFIPEKAGKITIVYSACAKNDENSIAQVSRVFEVKAEEGIKGLFITDNVRIEALNGGVLFIAEKNGSFTFVNPVYIDAFSLRLQIYDDLITRFDAFRALIVTAYECGNEENRASLELARKDILEDTLLEAEGFKLLFGKKAYIRFEFTGVTDTSAVIVKYFCNQPFSDSTKDIIKPVLSLTGSLVPEIAFGKIFTVPSAVCFDVYDPDARVYLTITKPSGEYLCESARIDNPISVLGDEYGAYQIEYRGRDHNGNNITLSYVVNVCDYRSPVIYLESEPVKTAKKGETLILPSAAVYDNLDTDVKAFVFIIEPDGYCYAVGEDGKFTANRAGIYTVWYYAQDKAGNYVTLKYTTEVK